MKKKRSKWLWIISGVVVLIILIIVGKSGDDEGVKVAVEKAANHTITETVTASGKIYPETEVKISPEVSGEIIELNVEEGDTVSKGQLLVKINPAIYNSAVNQAEASMQQTRSGVLNSQQMAAQSKANYEQALSNYNRNKKLYTDKVISALEYEQIEATYKSAKAAYDASQANISGGNYGVEASAASLSQARENLLKTTIIAPRSGIISLLSVKKGERVLGTAQMQGTNMLNIADMSRIELRVDVSETDIAKVKIGDTSIITADAYRSRKFTGVVSQIAVSSTTTTTATADQVTNYTVHILILPQSYADIVPTGKYKFPFKPGMSASVEIQTRKEPNILSVPVNAVSTRDWPDSLKNKEANQGIRQVVFVYSSKDKKVSLRDVKTGIQDNLFIQVTAGLKAGEEVVTAPYGAIARILANQTRVRVVDKNQLFEASSK